MKILLNAEPFGFGPSAITEQVRSILKDNPYVKDISYIGGGLTLNKHNEKDYVRIWDYSVMTEQEIIGVCSDFDYVITAMDTQFSKKAKKSKAKVIYIDALSWYWIKEQAPVEWDYYIYQTFIDEPLHLKNTQSSNIFEIAPILKSPGSLASKTSIKPQKNEKSTILVNLGGLENPFLPLSIFQDYAFKMCTAITSHHTESKIIIACSASIANALSQFDARPREYTSMQKLYTDCDFVYATSGLGNVLELSNHAKNCIFLPPANDSQGRQLHILIKAGYIHDYIDWSTIKRTSINWYEPQQLLLNKIHKNIQQLDSAKLAKCITKKINATLIPLLNTSLAQLVPTLNKKANFNSLQSVLNSIIC